MTAYYDTGPFFDYMIFASHAGVLLRPGPRRHRDVKARFDDAEECFKKIAKSHRGITSCHTLYEVESAMFSDLKVRAKGIAHAGRMLILSARPVVLQSIMIADQFGVEIKDLTRDLLWTAAQDAKFSIEGVKLGDTLHMTKAMREGAELIISADKDILKYDKKLRNTSGAPIRCLDTDEAKLLL